MEEIPRDPGGGRGALAWPGSRPWLVSVAFAATYAVAVRLGLASRVGGVGLALVWPAPVVALLWLAVSWTGRRRLLGNVLVLLAVGEALALAAGVGARSPASALANCAQAVVMAGLIRWLQPAPWRLRRPRDLAVLVLACAVGPLVGAIPSVLGGWETGIELVPAADAWALRNATNTFIFAALALRLSDRGLPHRHTSIRQDLEMLGTGLVLVAGYWVVFGPTGAAPLAFLVLPLSVWIALRFDTTVAAAHILFAAATVVLLTAAGRGPYGTSSATAQVLLTQGFIAVVALVTLTMALNRDERQALLERLVSARENAAAQAALLDAVFESISDGVAVAAADGTLLLLNPAARVLTAMESHSGPVGSLAGPLEVLRPDGEPFPTSELPLRRALSGEDVNGVDMLVRTTTTPDGRLLTVNARPLPGPPGQHGAVSIFHDVTRARLAEAELTYRALHDPLTGLANRTLLTDRLDNALAAASRSERRPGVICLDLDGFKAVNDTAGHAAGDELLVQLAGRLTQVVRPGDTVCRLGGDEFAVVCLELEGIAGLEVLADRILARLREPFILADGVFRVSASVGLAMSDDDTPGDQLLHRADQAMYAAKRAGKDRVGA